MAKEVVWTNELRTLVYRRLKQQFGPFRDWGKADYPDGKKAEYETALKDIAAFFSSLTGYSFKWAAVRQQVRWAIATQSGVGNQGNARSYIMNKAAALEVGFIKASDLPGMMLME